MAKKIKDLDLILIISIRYICKEVKGMMFLSTNGRLLLILLVSTGLTACNSFKRHPDSGYSSANSTPIRQQLEQERRAYFESFAREELGLGSGYRLTENEQAALNQRLQLKQAEQKLTTIREKKQYYNYKPLMKTDNERLYFLSLPSIEARERFVHQRGIASTVKEFTPEQADLIESNDISLGMTQKAVLESWGDPNAVEVAGNPVYGNERWKYSKYISSEAGYRREIRFVYFENGVVVGWESL